MSKSATPRISFEAPLGNTVEIVKAVFIVFLQMVVCIEFCRVITIEETRCFIARLLPADSLQSTT